MFGLSIFEDFCFADVSVSIRCSRGSRRTLTSFMIVILSQFLNYQQCSMCSNMNNYLSLIHI